MSHANEEAGRDTAGRRSLDGADDTRHTIPRPADEELVYRVDDKDEVVGAGRRKFDVLATIAGALAALGTFLLLTSLLSALGGTIGFETGLDDSDIAIGSVIGALVALFIACLVGGWVAGRIARHHEAKHGLVSPLWLILIAAVLAGLGALLGDQFNVTEKIGLPNWFSRDAWTTGAIIAGLLALALMLLGGWLGGKLASRHRDHASVAVVETKRAVRERPGGIVRGRSDR
ncbi:hypothetical protein SFC79_15550 [Nocardioides sp. S-58]|uniref:Major facilitator superfamily (MFS) profile domain-containing protein n=1 Tax=Nocardioides renjunii TaxID=3095075 RepID=A0ABU5KED7_9ACTN|nr:hypothetical protein [Nocardioides sp. S-58]MDZ5663187.1 hypothetical protein [Nocardioides sp. S-58]